MSTEIEPQKKSLSATIADYQVDFEKVLPSHIKPETFVRMAQGVLRKSPQVSRIASQNPGSYMRALLDCASKGHYPGTDRFWLVPNGGREPSVEGWESYKGVVNRMMRSGQVATVKCEVVYENDGFEFNPNQDMVPRHTVNWREDRGRPQLAYAYAVLPNGQTSKVGIATPGYIAEVEKMQPNSNKPNSPWQKWRDSMFAKCAVNRLEPFVDTSNEELRTAATGGKVVVMDPPVEDQPQIDEVDGELVDYDGNPIDENGDLLAEGMPTDVTGLGDGEPVPPEDVEAKADAKAEKARATPPAAPSDAEDETAVDRSDALDGLFDKKGSK